MPNLTQTQQIKLRGPKTPLHGSLAPQGRGQRHADPRCSPAVLCISVPCSTHCQCLAKAVFPPLHRNPFQNLPWNFPGFATVTALQVSGNLLAAPDDLGGLTSNPSFSRDFYKFL